MKVIGIDFGTSLCRTALFRNCTVEVIPNRYTVGKLPTLVEFHKGNKHEYDTNGAHLLPFFFNSIKQKVGCEPFVQFENREIALIDWASDIFHNLKDDAKKHINEDICGAVVTVPAFFSDRQRVALKSAAERGGFSAIRLLDEDISVFMASELHE